jgi:cold shock CspA family protein/ribosome-associated translation inhibitor RaiA
MQTEPQITFHGTDVSPHVQELAHRYLAKLERHYDRITTVRVVIERAHDHAGHNAIWEVRIEIGVPGSELVVTHEPGRESRKRDLDATLRDAFKAAERRLDTWSAKRRGDVKRREEPLVGELVNLHFGEGYGFIRTVDAREIYFTDHALIDVAFDELDEGLQVRFVEGDSGTEGPMATTVRLLD